MCSKDLDEQYTPDIVFLFCTALLFILMSLLQMHYIILPCMVYRTNMPLKQFSIAIQFLLKMSADCYVIQFFQLCSSRCV